MLDDTQLGHCHDLDWQESSQKMKNCQKISQFLIETCGQKLLVLTLRLPIFILEGYTITKLLNGFIWWEEDKDYSVVIRSQSAAEINPCLHS